MPVQFKVSVDIEGWRKATLDEQQRVIKAEVAALRETAQNAVTEGRRNIAAAGHFGTNWQRDLQFRMVGKAINTVAIVFHKSALASIFEYGKTIAGKPLLWIPINPRMPPIKRSDKRLTFAIVSGRHLAFDADDRDRHRRPLYIGVPIARIPKIWRITEIVEANVSRFTEVFLKYFTGK